MKKAINAIVVFVLVINICSCTAYNEDENEPKDMSQKDENIFARLIGMDAEGLDFAKLYGISMDGYETEHVSLRAEWIADGINAYYRAVPEKYEKNTIIRSWNEEIICNGIKYYTALYHAHADTFTSKGAIDYYVKEYKYNDCGMDCYLTYSSEQKGAADRIEITQAVKAFENVKCRSCDFEEYLEYWSVSFKKDDLSVYIKIYPSNYGKPLFDEFIAEEHVELQHKENTEYYYGTKIMPNPEVMEQKLMMETGIGILEIKAMLLTAGQKEREFENNAVTIDLAHLFLSQFLKMQ